MTGKARRRLGWALVIAASLIALVLLLRPAAVPVETARISRGRMQVAIQEEGQTRIEPRHIVASPVQGRMVPTGLQEGDALQPGATVARLYPAPLDARGREQAETMLRSARGAHKEAEARASENAALAAQAALTRERNERLASSGEIAREELDRSRSEEQALAHALRAARARAESARCDVENAKAALMQSGASAALAVCAPAMGVVLRVFEESERVVEAGAPLIEIGDPSALEVVVDVLSTDAVAIRPGTPMLLHAGHGLTMTGRVVRVEPAAFTKVSPLGVEEQRVHVIGEILEPGAGVGDRYRVDAEIVLWEADNVLVAPPGAVFRTDSGWAVFTVDRGRARLRAVEAGRRNFEQVEILEGLEEGDVVVVYPGDRVADGVRVSVK